MNQKPPKKRTSFRQRSQGSKKTVHDDPNDFSRYNAPDPKKNFHILFYDTFPAAKADSEKINSLCTLYDQVNLAIKAEGNMDDPELLGINPRVKVYAGAAWYLIHERRMEENWYQKNTNNSSSKPH